MAENLLVNHGWTVNSANVINFIVVLNSTVRHVIWPMECTQMTLGTLFFTLMRGDQVGTDSVGNKYYKERRSIEGRSERRWVIYAGDAESSKVPAEWHGWLHSRTNVLGAETVGEKRSWQKVHTPNLTGTQAAYRPPGHVSKGAKRDKATGDYKAWCPK